jgi:4-hydroxybenzoate polyprenyltransferase
MDPTQLRSAAAEYRYLRGLIQVPLGLLFIAAALGNEHWGPLENDWVFVAVLVLLAGVAAAVNRFYDEHYGRVTPTADREAKAIGVGLLGAAVLFGASLLLRSRASWSLDLPVNPIPGVFGLLMLAYSATVVTLRPHHVVIWGSLAVAGLLPVWSGDDPSNAGLVMCGIAVMANGVFDHLQIVRTMGPPTMRTDG